jgi:predicted RNA-binding Zn-ribbon protein involved in translation (DUF1610 family)
MIDRPVAECPRCGSGVSRTGGHTEDIDAEGHWIQTGQCLSCGAQLERGEGIIEWTVADSLSGEGDAAAESG